MYGLGSQVGLKVEGCRVRDSGSKSGLNGFGLETWGFRLCPVSEKSAALRARPYTYRIRTDHSVGGLGSQVGFRMSELL